MTWRENGRIGSAGFATAISGIERFLPRSSRPCHARGLSCTSLQLGVLKMTKLEPVPARPATRSWIPYAAAVVEIVVHDTDRWRHLAEIHAAPRWLADELAPTTALDWTGTATPSRCSGISLSSSRR
jgi:hypothetical protein